MRFLQTILMNKVIFFISLSVLFFSTKTFSQSTESKKEGTLTINADARLDSLVQIHKKTNEEKQTMPGYRVQLFFGTERQKGTDIRSGFLKKHAEISAYLIYQQPNYKVRVGDFRTRLEAYKLFQQLNVEYPSAFVVKDEIALPPLE